MAVAISVKDCGGTGGNLILIHGFLGSGDDWKAVLPSLKEQFHCYTVDLPGHGQSVECEIPENAVSLLPEIADALYRKLQNNGLLPAIILGYSLGGRVAMTLASRMKAEDITALVLEGAHPGLETTEDKQQRIVNDSRWAARFQSEPLQSVLNDWYQQPVFQSLTTEERAELVEERSRLNNGAALATILSGCSLGAQESLWPAVSQMQCPVYYLVGERDEKFSRVAQRLKAQGKITTANIPDAGHNAHRDNPKEFSKRLKVLFRRLG